MNFKKDTQEKICPTCGKTFQRRRFGNRLEDFSRFNARIYCSKSCSAKRNLSNIETRSISSFRNEAKKFRKDYCENCGSKDHVQIHHKDSNFKNNSPDNLVSLCRHCHMVLHWMLWRSKKKFKGFAHSYKRKVSRHTETQLCHR